MENFSTTCEFLLQISQNRSLNRVCPPSKVSHCCSVTRIRHPRRLFIANGKFVRVLMHRVFFNRRQIFPPIRGPRIRGVTVFVQICDLQIEYIDTFHHFLSRCKFKFSSKSTFTLPTWLQQTL